MVGMPLEDLVFLTHYQNNELREVEVLLSHALDVGHGDGVDAAAILLVVIRVFGVAAGKFVLGEGAGDLLLRGESAWKSVDETAFGRVEFVDGHWFGGDTFDFLEHDGGRI